MDKPVIVIEVNEGRIVGIIANTEIEIIFRDRGTEQCESFIEIFPAIIDKNCINKIIDNLNELKGIDFNGLSNNNIQDN